MIDDQSNLEFLDPARAHTPLCPWRLRVIDTDDGPCWHVLIEGRFGQKPERFFVSFDYTVDEREVHWLAHHRFTQMAKLSQEIRSARLNDRRRA